MSPNTKNTTKGHYGACPKSLSSFLHPQCKLNLIDYTGTGTCRKCDVCGDHADGFVYQCKGCEFDVHPLCTSIPRELNHVLHPNHKLVYQSSVARPCALCGSACMGWRYGCAGCGFHIHPECVLLKSREIPTNHARSPAVPAHPPPPYAAYASGIPYGFGNPYNFYNYHFAPNMQYQYAYAQQPPCYMQQNYANFQPPYYSQGYGNFPVQEGVAIGGAWGGSYGNFPVQGGGVANGGAWGGNKMFQIVSQLALGVVSNVIFGQLSSIF